MTLNSTIHLAEPLISVGDIMLITFKVFSFIIAVGLALLLIWITCCLISKLPPYQKKESEVK